MRNDAYLLGPEPRRNQLFMVACWEVNKPMYAPLQASNTPGDDVLAQELGGVASLCGLLRCEVAGLACSGLEQMVPFWTGRIE